MKLILINCNKLLVTKIISNKTYNTKSSFQTGWRLLRTTCVLNCCSFTKCMLEVSRKILDLPATTQYGSLEPLISLDAKSLPDIT